MKKLLLKLALNISLWLEDILSIYRDVSVSSRIADEKDVQKLITDIEEISLMCMIIKPEASWKRKIIANRVSGIIISILRRCNYKKLYVTKKPKELMEQLNDCFNLGLIETELGFRFGEKHETCWTPIDGDNRKRLILSKIALQQLEENKEN